MHRSSYCGVNCEKCKVYIATTENDDSKRARVAAEWGAEYKMNFTTEEINCLGCKSHVVFHLCSMCDIKGCNEGHGVTNCQDCQAFPCARINRFFDYHKEHDLGTAFD